MYNLLAAIFFVMYCNLEKDKLWVAQWSKALLLIAVLFSWRGFKIHLSSNNFLYVFILKSYYNFLNETYVIV